MQDVKKYFPYFDKPQSVHYLDSAAATLMPRQVSQRLNQFYCHEMSNVHRASHKLGNQATEAYESARARVAQHIGALRAEEIVFTRSTTESINLVAHSWGGQQLQAGDQILLTEMEHHSNLVPWQQVAQQTGAYLQYVTVTQQGELDLEDLENKLKQTKILAFTSCSNVLGSCNPVQKICALARKYKVCVLVDAAQSMAFQKVDVQKWDCDFLVFSGHKMFGPFGAGVLWGRYQHLLNMPVYQSGGAMIKEVQWQKSHFLDPPQKFEAGTPHVVGAVALASAVDWLHSKGIENIGQHDTQLARLARQKLQSLKNIQVHCLGPELLQDTSSCSPVLSFVIEGFNCFDVAQLLDQHQVAVRAGHHCCQPLLSKLKKPAVLRASFSVYNDEQDVQALCEALQKACQLLEGAKPL